MASSSTQCCAMKPLMAAAVEQPPRRYGRAVRCGGPLRPSPSSPLLKPMRRYCTVVAAMGTVAQGELSRALPVEMEPLASDQTWSLLTRAQEALQGVVANGGEGGGGAPRRGVARLLEEASLRMMTPDAVSLDHSQAARAALAASFVTHSGGAVDGSSASAVLTSNPETLLVTSILLGVAGACALVGGRAVGGEGREEAVELPSEYDPITLTQYWRQRPVKIAERAATLCFEVTRFAVALRSDELLGRSTERRAQRARQLRLLVQRLGPTYIKLAQALSTRGDILPPEYIAEIEQLQNAVEPFSSATARKIVAEQLGRDPETVFAEISDEPLAAASLGQVYKARLVSGAGGAEVAVKVQRPGVLETVAADLYILRSVANLQRYFPLVLGRTDFGALVDSWGVRFFAEMNFCTEAKNAATFRRQMQERGLEGVVVPRTYWELSSNMLLVTEWVHGQQLSETQREDVRDLCCTLLNCYLTQLLDTGFMHADPHPGNLIVTRDGALCLLDWGLITEIDAETRITLVEFIAHMQTEDWARVADDLMALGFVAPEGGSPRDQGLVEPLGEILGQLTRVGGDSGVNIEKVTRDLDSLSKRFPYFTIPPYFALILRAFSVIEGIALTVDPHYAIVRECMPYLAQRMLSDDSPRMQELLRQLLYGDGQSLDMQRLQKLADGFVGFKTDGLTSGGEQTSASSRTEAVTVLDPRVKQGLRVILRSGGSFSQELIVNELVNAVDALGREALLEAAALFARSIPGSAALSRSPLAAIVLPFVRLPLRGAAQLSDEDRAALATVRGIMSLFAEESTTTTTSTTTGRTDGAARWQTAEWGDELLALLRDPRAGVRSSVALGQELIPLAGELAPGLANLWTKVTVRLLQRTIVRLRENAV